MKISEKKCWKAILEVFFSRLVPYMANFKAKKKPPFGPNENSVSGDFGDIDASLLPFIHLCITERFENSNKIWKSPI